MATGEDRRSASVSGSTRFLVETGYRWPSQCRKGRPRNPIGAHSEHLDADL